MFMELWYTELFYQKQKLRLKTVENVNKFVENVEGEGRSGMEAIETYL